MGAVPLGRREDQRLEFKGTDALKNPFSISREAVAMLNASGGEIWIGLRDENGYAVEVEGVPNVDLAREDLLNHLIEVVEPRVRPNDVLIEKVHHEGRDLLRLDVARRTKAGPYAQLRGGARHFLVRIDHRIRPMTREEIFGTTPDAGSPDRLRSLRADVLKRDLPGLWIGLESSIPLSIDVQSDAVESLLRDPSRSGNRAQGWNFLYPAFLGVAPRLAEGRLEVGDSRHRQTTVWEDGCVEFWTAMDGLRHRTDSTTEIHPLALLEFSVSIMRLAARVYEQSPGSARGDVFVDSALLGLEGWQLPAYAPSTYGYSLGVELPQTLEDGQFLLPTPLRFPRDEFVRGPDHAGYMIVRSIYQAFHLPEDRIPRQYDRVNHSLVMED